MKRIARVVVPDGQGRFLAILENDKKRRVAFPGGHIDKGETPEQAAAREVWEETGLSVTSLVPLCKIVSEDRVTYMFLGGARGKLRSSHEGTACWRRPKEFIQGRWGKFSEAVFQCLDDSAMQ